MLRSCQLAFAGCALAALLAPAALAADPTDVSVQLPNVQGYEKEGVEARFRIVRSAAPALGELSVRFTLAGSDDPSLGSASPDDYTLTDGSGNPVEDAVVLPQGATSVDVVVAPIQDELIEVPELLQLNLVEDSAYTLGTTASGTVRINDATNIASNDRLFLAMLSPESGIQTSGSGFSVVRLRGDNDRAIVELTFSGLTTIQTAVHIHISNPVDGPHVESLPLGQVTDHEWDIRAAQFLVSDQQVLDALLTGQLYVNVHSSMHPAGEIRGQYYPHEGSTELIIPPDPPALGTLTGEALDRDIVRFLMQSTFGATPELLDELRQLIEEHDGDRIAGMEAWIDAQMDPEQSPAGNLLEFTHASSQIFAGNAKDRQSGWWLFARYGQDQLRQRVAFALSEILVVSDLDGKVSAAHLATADYYDMLIQRAFDRYRDLLLDVSLNPVMGTYLSHLRNQKALVDETGQVITRPDENYAREVMQLFAFGLLRRHLDGTIVLDASGLPITTYDNMVITEIARVFTGLSFSKYDKNGQVKDNNKFNRGLSITEPQTRWLYPMKMFEDYHDAGEKVVFDGHVIPAGQPGMADIEAVHDLLAAHPTTAPFISRLLIQRLVTSNPSRGYVYRVAKRFQETDGDLGQVIKAILLDYEARSPELIEDVGYGKQKEPLLRFTALLRLLDVASQVPLSELNAFGYPAGEFAKFPADATMYRLLLEDKLDQVAQSSPTVFNFFLPDYRHPGKLGNAGLSSPEFQLSTESQLYGSIDLRHLLLLNDKGLNGNGVPEGYSNDADNLHPDLSVLQQVHDAALATGTVESASEALLDYIDLYLNAGGLRQRYADAAEPNPRSLMLQTIAHISGAKRVRNAVYVVESSPQLAIQR